jgi:hypothetical protein
VYTSLHPNARSIRPAGDRPPESAALAAAVTVAAP